MGIEKSCAATSYGVVSSIEGEQKGELKRNFNAESHLITDLTAKASLSKKPVMSCDAGSSAEHEQKRNPLKMWEIVDMVFTHLSLVETFRAASTSRLFAHTAALNTKTMKKKRFELSIDRYESLWFDSDYQPIMLPFAKPVTDMERFEILHPDVWLHGRPLPIVELHPLLWNATAVGDDQLTIMTCISKVSVDFEWLFELPPGNWLDMFITQPPIHGLEIMWQPYRHRGEASYSNPLPISVSVSPEKKNGITFRDLLCKVLTLRLEDDSQCRAGREVLESLMFGKTFPPDERYEVMWRAREAYVASDGYGAYRKLWPAGFTEIWVKGVAFEHTHLVKKAREEAEKAAKNAVRETV